ncbi:HK97 gp10 family phage protein [Chitinolyticbacter meiyuanensis]|uniref:HK97 gp10 family phage protein n=1 Tax=Chitinolyticbacter meiyuanensis TaxID=682798 RepID=UPI0011E59C01|nr:HK97 gp10 family phage protein [Chitinolyticbacter meiyuanensis]
MRFAKQVSAWSERSMDKVDRATREIGLVLFSSAIRKTPVDTGRARGNWQVGFTMAQGATTREDKAGALAINDVMSLLKPGIFKQDNQVWLTNNLPYILKLEYGSSKQSPQGMVRLSFEEMEPAIRAIVSRISRSR